MVYFTLKCSTVSAHLGTMAHTVMLCAQVLLLLSKGFFPSVFAMLKNAQLTPFVAAFTQSHMTVTRWLTLLFTAKTRLFRTMLSMPLPHQFPWARSSNAITASGSHFRTTTYWTRCAASSATVAQPKKAIAALPRSATLGR